MGAEFGTPFGLKSNSEKRVMREGIFSVGFMFKSLHAHFLYELGKSKFGSI